MVKRVRHIVLPRLKSDAGLPFFFPMRTYFYSPSFEGLFYVPVFLAKKPA